MRTTVPLLIVSVLLLSLPGCGQDRAIPDSSVPHRLAADVDATIYVRTPAGDLQEQPTRIPAGWYVVSPVIVEGH